MEHFFQRNRSLASLAQEFGIRSRERLAEDLKVVLHRVARREQFDVGLSSAGLVRPDLSLPAYAGVVPADGLAPIYNLFDRVGGGKRYRTAVTRVRARDFRGGRLTYDDHDGVDLVCPPGTALRSAAPGVLVAVRDTWLRGGMTACVDHGNGVVTHYTHLSRMVAEVGQPLRRGETVALSGVTGLDMTSFFPWVPPHVHFMIWVDGRPVDPFRAPSEPERAGTWVGGNEPLTVSGSLPEDEEPEREASIGVDRGALERVMSMCRSERVRAELRRACSEAGRVAIVEDDRHHGWDNWPDEARVVKLREGGEARRVKLTLPLPASDYRGVRIADRWWTRPGA
ncbi:MAG: M23 family metallopeptidase [Deltaproteobacteria bacterium]|nr:M23 family metallopeptidase [Deltaproteobacteria bacterium]